MKDDNDLKGVGKRSIEAVYRSKETSAELEEIGSGLSRFYEQEERDAELMSNCKTKVEIVKDVLRTLVDEIEKNRSKIDHPVDEQGRPDVVPFSQEYCQAVVDEISADDYEPPDDLIILTEHAVIMNWLYEGGSSRPMSLNIVSKLDIAAFKILPLLGQMCGDVSRFCLKLRHTEGVLKGKQQQKKQTIDMILKAYMSLGANWLDDESKKPILLKNNRISINKLAGEIFMRLNGNSTQRHIANCIKELRKKGEI